MRIKLNFQKELLEDFSDKPAFRPKPSQKPLPGHPGLELFLSKIEKDIFENLVKDSTAITLNMTKEERDALRGLADDRSIVIKKADKDPCVVVWCRDNYIKEAENQLRDNTVYKDVNFKETMLSDLVEKKAISFLNVCTVGKALRKKNSNTFPINLKRQPTSVNYMFCHKRLSNVPGRPAISNCGTPTEKASEFLDFYLKPLMQNGWSYIRDW